MGGSHVLTRVKSFNIFVDSLITEKSFTYPFRPELKKSHYTVSFHDASIQNEISYENFNYNIITTEINPYADSLVNEIWPILRTLWRARGGYDICIKFNPAIDFAEFGGHFGTGLYTAEYNFQIDKSGSWTADFKIDFVQEYDSINDPREDYRHGPFFAQEFSRMQGNAAIRARQLAKPKWGENGRSHEDFDNLLNEEFYLNQITNWNFNWSWNGQGNWNNSEINKINLPDTISYPIAFYRSIE